MTLETRVNDQFQRHDDLRVLFLFDPEGSYADEVAAWSNGSIRCMRIDDVGFRHTYQLEHDAAAEKVLLYVPGARPRDLENFQLADLLVANRVLHIDRIAEFMEEFGLDDRHRRIVQKYFKGDLEYKNRQEVLLPILKPGRFTEPNVQRGLAAYFLEAASFRTIPSEEELIAAVFVEAVDAQKLEEYSQKAEEHGFSEYVGGLLSRRFDLDSVKLDAAQVKEAAQKLKYNLLCRNLEIAPDDPYAKRLRVENPTTLRGLVAIATVWESSANIIQPYEPVLDGLAADIDESRLLEAYGSEAEFGYLSSTIRLARLKGAVESLRTHPSRVRGSIAGPLRGSTDEGTRVVAELLWHMASFYTTLRGYSTLDWSTPDQFVQEYTHTLRACDAHYRHASTAYRNVRRRFGHYRDLIDEVFERFLHDYDEEFVTAINVPWQRCIENAVAAGKELPGEPLSSFHKTYMRDPQKTAVVVSDGLRYEAARMIQKRLQRQKRFETELRWMRAPLPSVTSLGKASLLPHEKIEWDGDDFTIAGQRTAGTEQREAVLKSVNESARALSYGSISALNRLSGRELFTEHPLVYIYHDRIDAIGDKRDTEADTLQAVEQTIEEIFDLIRTLNNFNVYRVIVTSDHGFLYSEREIPEAQQEPFPAVDEPILRRNRCIVASHVASETGYSFPVRSVSTVDADWTVVVPRAVNRYKLQGAGKRYAHGGASLQEMIVPVLEVRKLREDISEKVGAQLVTRTNAITSGILKVQIVQTSSVSEKTRPRTLEIALYDSAGDVISDEVRLVLDSTSSAPSDRTHTIVLKLLPVADNLNACRLKAYDEEDTTKLNPVIDQRFTIQRLFGQEDF